MTENNTTTNRLTSYSFDDASNGNPMVTDSDTSVTWQGAMRAYARRSSGTFVGSVTVDTDDFSSSNVDVVFSSDRVEFLWEDIALTNGTFEYSDETIKGGFYGCHGNQTRFFPNEFPIAYL